MPLPFLLTSLLKVNVNVDSGQIWSIYILVYLEFRIFHKNRNIQEQQLFLIQFPFLYNNIYEAMQCFGFSKMLRLYPFSENLIINVFVYVSLLLSIWKLTFSSSEVCRVFAQVWTVSILYRAVCLLLLLWPLSNHLSNIFSKLSVHFNWKYKVDCIKYEEERQDDSRLYQCVWYKRSAFRKWELWQRIGLTRFPFD